MELWLHTFLHSVLIKVSGQLQSSTSLAPGREPHCPLDKRGGLQSVSGRCSYGKNLFSLQGVEHQFIGRHARTVINVQNELPKLLR
jgi:hypothetical protein